MYIYTKVRENYRHTTHKNNKCTQVTEALVSIYIYIYIIHDILHDIIIMC